MNATTDADGRLDTLLTMPGDPPVWPPDA